MKFCINISSRVPIRKEGVCSCYRAPLECAFLNLQIIIICPMPTKMQTQVKPTNLNNFQTAKINLKYLIFD